MDLEKLTRQVSDLCREVGRHIESERSGKKDLGLEKKGKNNYVTRVDKTAEKMLIGELKNFLPEAGILAEEGTGNEKADDIRWIVDPIDGTTNFIYGIPFYSISVALEIEKTLVLGVIFDIVHNDCFYAWQHGPAMLNGQTIRVSDSASLGDSLVATGFPYEHRGLNRYLALFNDMVYRSRGLRRLGSAALDLAYVACGRFGGFFELGLNPWDVSAGIVIVKQAGGQLSDFSGNQGHPSGKEIVASNGKIHDEMLNLVAEHYGTK